MESGKKGGTTLIPGGKKNPWRAEMVNLRKDLGKPFLCFCALLFPALEIGLSPGRRIILLPSTSSILLPTEVVNLTCIWPFALAWYLTMSYSIALERSLAKLSSSLSIGTHDDLEAPRADIAASTARFCACFMADSLSVVLRC